MRVLITGSRDWTDRHAIAEALSIAGARAEGQVTLVSGACPTGADAIAEDVAQALGWQVERHPAQWGLWGKSAGPLRNQQMVDAGADICLAFIKDNSRGATHCASRAQAAGITTVITRA